MNGVSALGLIASACACGIAYAGYRLSRRKVAQEDADRTENRLERKLQEFEGDLIQTKRELDDCKAGRLELTQQNFQLLMEINDLRKKVTGNA